MTRAKRISVEILFVFALALGALLGCGTGGEGRGGTQDSTTPSGSERPDTKHPDLAGSVAVDQGSIRGHLESLTGISPVSIEGRDVRISERGSERGRRAAASYMEASFEELGIPARVLEFDADGLHGFNVEATLRGTSGERHLWMTAHLDSVRNPGANDDASGLASILLTAEALEQLDPEHTVHFVAFDLEEVGLLGSSHYVESTVNPIRDTEGEEAIIGDLQSDMIAYEVDGFDAVLGTCGQAGPIDDVITRAAEEIHSPIELSEVCLGRSDHEPFWDAGLSAAVLTDGAVYDGYPCYHEPCDTVDKLNLSYTSSMIELTAATAAMLAVPHGRD